MGFLSDIVKVAAPVAGFLVAGPAGAAVGAGISAGVAGVEQAGLERDAAKVQRRQAKLQAWQRQMSQLRDLQVAQASAGTAFQASGASLESSGAQGVQSSLISQTAQNTGLVSQGVEATNALTRIQNDMSRNSMYASIGQLAGSITQAGAGLFGGPVTNTTSLTPNDVQNFGTTSIPSGTTTPMPVYNTIRPGP